MYTLTGDHPIGLSWEGVGGSVQSFPTFYVFSVSGLTFEGQFQTDRYDSSTDAESKVRFDKIKVGSKFCEVNTGLENR